jgi:hypothetical protein
LSKFEQTLHRKGANIWQSAAKGVKRARIGNAS